MGGLLSCIAFSVCLRAHLGIEGILGNLNFLLLNDGFLLLLHNVCSCSLALNILLLNLLLNLIRSVCFCVFRIGFNLQRCLTHGKIGLLLSNVEIGVHTSLIGCLVGSSLSFRNFLI